VYGVTQTLGQERARQHDFFALSPDGEVRELGPARGYTASMALDENRARFYYVPGAHGDSSTQGTPIIAVDTETGEQQVIARLNDLAEQHLGLTLAGRYDVAFDAEDDRLYVGLNAGTDEESPWGEVVLAIVEFGG
jgi:hypothetical protein